MTRILPKGRYWISIVSDDNEGTWLGWLDAFRDSVHVEVTEDHDPGVLESGKPWKFYIFTTSKDLVWERGDFPNDAPASIKSSNDTVDRPNYQLDFPDRLDEFTKRAAASLSSTVGVLTWGLVIGLGVYAYVNLRKTPKRKE